VGGRESSRSGGDAGVFFVMGALMASSKTDMDVVY
jgi:hypothetical protein